MLSQIFAERKHTSVRRNSLQSLGALRLSHEKAGVLKGSRYIFPEANHVSDISDSRRIGGLSASSSSATDDEPPANTRIDPIASNITQTHESTLLISTMLCFLVSDAT